jgi:NifU-like protein
VAYPRRIAFHVSRCLARAGDQLDSAQGAAVNLACGSYIRFYLSVAESGHIDTVGMRSNGCGYMLASADVIAEQISGLDPRELHGYNDAEFHGLVVRELGELDGERLPCAGTAIEALRSAFADLRARRVSEFQGEEALICTCFGVTEERILRLINQQSLQTVEEIGAACNAGNGCGSCTILIDELLMNTT